MKQAFLAALLPFLVQASPAYTTPEYKPSNIYSRILGYPSEAPQPPVRPNDPETNPTTPGVNGDKFIDWRTFKANGVNLGSWLEKEKVHDPVWWNQYAPDTQDEWTFCEALGSRCGPILEERYNSFLNKSTIDLLASVGINTLRIPMTYAAWVKVPGSQVEHLRSISSYAIEKYGMHVIVGLHSLPGGVNSLDIGEGYGRGDWFFNQTNLAYSYEAVDKILNSLKILDM